MRRAAAIFGGAEPQLFEWSGENSPRVRLAAATELAGKLRGQSSIHLLGFSHGGNVAAKVASLLPPGAVETLVTIATPVLRGRYRPAAALNHIHLYSDRDLMQRGGGEWFRLPHIGSIGLARRSYPEASGVRNIRIEGVATTGLGGRHGDILWWDETWLRLEEALRLPAGNIPG